MSESPVTDRDFPSNGSMDELSHGRHPAQSAGISALTPVGPKCQGGDNASRWTYRGRMADAKNNPDDIPNGSGNGSTSDDAADTSSGGAPDQPESAPDKEESDGTPVENPAG